MYPQRMDILMYEYLTSCLEAEASTLRLMPLGANLPNVLTFPFGNISRTDDYITRTPPMVVAAGIGATALLSDLLHCRRFVVQSCHALLAA